MVNVIRFGCSGESTETGYNCNHKPTFGYTQIQQRIQRMAILIFISKFLEASVRTIMVTGRFYLHKFKRITDKSFLLTSSFS